MSRLLSTLAAAIAVLMIVAVAIVNPDRINYQINQFFGWHPDVPGDTRLVPEILARQIHFLSSGVTPEEIRARIDTFSRMDSRVTGYPGAESAYHYLKGEFQRLRLQNIRTDTFEVAVPMDRGADLYVTGTLGKQIRLYSLWPNGVRTSSLPEKGVTGSVIYGGKGSLEDLDGKPVEGSIILLDFDSGQDWLNAATLGARAIVFFDNGVVNREQATDKFLKVPVDIPRFWIGRQDAEFVRARIADANAGGPVANGRVQAHMDWISAEAYNLYGWMPGTAHPMPANTREIPQDWADQIIVIQAYYDAISIAPALAPGAESAAGIAALLAMAEVLQRHQPDYSILFLATSGHFQGLAGINDFLYRHSRGSEHFRERMDPEQRIDFDLMLSLDLTSHNRRTISFGNGTFYAPKWETDNYVKFMLTPYSKRLSLAVEEIFADSLRHLEGVAPPKRTWKNFMPVPLALSSESVIFVGKKALALATANDARERIDTPLDLPEFVNYENLAQQFHTLRAMLMWASHDAELLSPTKLELEDYGHSLAGNIFWFDRQVNFAVPKKPVPNALVTYQQLGPNSVGGVRSLIVDRADSFGRFQFDIMRNRFTNRIKAYQLDEATGAITSAPDWGQEGDETYPMEHPWGWWENEMLQVLFECESLSLFETVDSRYLSVLDYITVLNERDGVPQMWGADYVEDQSTEEGKVTLASVVYAEPGTRVKALMSTSLFGVPYLLSGSPKQWLHEPLSEEQVDEATLKAAYGKGYLIDQGVLWRPAFAAARDMWILDDVRIKQLARYGVRNDKFMRLHADAREALLDASEHLEAQRYSDYKAAVRRAWGLETRGYPDIKSTADDTVYGVIFYFALLLPFSYFCERALFGFADIRKQLLGAAGFFIGIFVVMRYIHPAFKLSSSPYIIFLAFVIFAIGGTALFMLLSRFSRSVADRKRAASGVHEADIGRLSATAAAIDLGISNLRKRPMRTFLTVATITLLTFTAQAFTSVQTYIKFYQIARDTEPSYEGALLRDRGWRGLQMSVLGYVQSAFGEAAAVIPRSWYHTKKIGEREFIDVERVEDDTRFSSFAYALLGFTPQERDVMGLDGLLQGASSRWFEEGDRSVCILPAAIAEIVGIDSSEVGEATIRFMGKTWKVIGLIDGDAMDRVRDLDGEALTPVDAAKEAKKMEQMEDLDPRLADTSSIETFSHLSANNVLLVPFEDVIDLNGRLYSMAITGFSDIERLTGDVEDFVTRVAVPLFVGKEGKVRVYTSMGSAALAGVTNVLVPILIAALIVLNTMMGAVYERDREIGVYSSVGLAPSHISALFIAESLVYATLGAVLGYLLGQSIALFLTRNDLMGGMFMNYSSLSAIVSTVIVMLTVVLSAIYPARKAASMSVPDVTRQWKFPDPEGDNWHFDFPFTIARSDALGVCAYLHRIFSAYGEGSVGDFMTEAVSLHLERPRAEQANSTYRLDLMVWLAPYDLGVSQHVHLRTMPSEDLNGVYRVEMEIYRVSGDVASWRRLNTTFLNVLRKRFLVWRTVSDEVRQEYLDEGAQLVQAEVPTGQPI
ncbi:MAG: FtsX-like permease family protein [Candidatus Latescibacterota bacterium]|nr:FtsX-like permease family protein [Candidatus Latescibacterota bacterium]